MNNFTKDCISNWVPYKLSHENGGWLCHWLYLKDKTFTAPFFEETIHHCMGLYENSRPYKSASGLNMLAEWAGSFDTVEPTAFIFHVSRCGSTLISQTLSLDEKNIVLSEVPFFDDLLRLSLKDPTITEQNSSELLAAAIKFYGARRHQKEAALFIKTDSWHLLFYRQLRELFPQTPFIFLYRSPLAVLDSHARKKGMQAVKGLIEPALFGFNEKMMTAIHANDYMALVLEKYFRQILNIMAVDSNSLLVNYNEGMPLILQKLAAFTGIGWKEIDEIRFLERCRYHAKEPHELFIEKSSLEVSRQPPGQLSYLYNELEKSRLVLKPFP